MPSKKKEAQRQRTYRKHQRDYVRGLEVRVVQQDAAIALLRGMLGHVEEGVPNPTVYDRLVERIAALEKRDTMREADLARVELMLDSMLAEEWSS